MTPAQAQEFSFAPARHPQRNGMTDDYLHLPIGDKTPEVVTAVIEIPQDSVNKYEYDRQFRVFRLDRNLHSSIHYPGDHGFVPVCLGTR
jgi:inorganic pyrophosphatase